MVTAFNGNAYAYDLNGNMISRTVNGQTYTLSYDAENRLISVTGGSLSAQFTYDGDGKRVKSTINGVTTYFVGNYYEVSGTTATSYYYSGSQRVAMRVGSSVYYLLTDQLGSTSITTDASGVKLAELRYDAWGGVRSTSGTTPTKYTYTGQYSHVADFGLMFYNARWLDPALGRFTSADTLVPDGVQGYDRYAYANNSPVVYADPSGHCVQPGDAPPGSPSNNNICTGTGGGGGAGGSGAASPDPMHVLNGCESPACYHQTLGQYFAGYSGWEIGILNLLYNWGGPDAVHGVQYILENNIHIQIGEPYVRHAAGSKGYYYSGNWQSAFNIGGWFDGQNVYLNPNQFKASDVPGSAFALQTIIHEALHVEQGFWLSHSWEGERLAWQAGARVYGAFGQSDSRFVAIQNSQDPYSFAWELLAHDPDYAKRMILGYPAYPIGF